MFVENAFTLRQISKLNSGLDVDNAISRLELNVRNHSTQQNKLLMNALRLVCNYLEKIVNK